MGASGRASPSQEHAPTFTSRSPIFIEGNANFTTENGVTRGSGTPGDPYVIEGWEIGPTSGAGIEIRYTDAHFTIRDVYVHDAVGAGIALQQVANGSIENATISQNGDGVFLGSGESNTIANSTFTSNRPGIYLSNTVNATVSWNEFTQDGIFLTGIGVESFSSHTILNNTVNGKPLLYLSNCNNLGIDGITVGQLIIANCIMVQLNNMSISNTTAAVQLAHVSIANVTSSDLLTSIWGIHILHSNDVLIWDNNLSQNEIGILATDASFTSVVANEIVANSQTGLYTYGAQGLTIAENKFQGPGVVGVKAEVAASLYIRDNEFANLSTNVHLDAFSDVHVYYNNFTGPSTYVVDDGAASWDNGYPEGGNRWADYYGGDRCRGPSQSTCPGPDGIGDTPYVIDGNSVDRYPLVTPPSELPPNSPPTAFFTVNPASGPVGTQFTADASMSSDHEDPPGELWVRWDWQNDGQWVTEWIWDRKYASFQYTQPGHYTIRLDVLDSGGLLSSATRTVEVTEGSPGEPEPPEELSFTLAQISYPGKNFRLLVPESWSVEWDYDFGELGTVDLLVMGPTIDSFQTNIIVESEEQRVEESDEFLLETASETVELLLHEFPILVVHQPEVISTNQSRAVYFAIEHLDVPVHQMIAIYVNESISRTWALIASLPASAAESYEPVIMDIIRSFEILEAPAPTPTPIPPLVYVALGAAAVVGAGAALWVLRRRRRPVEPPPSQLELTVRPTQITPPSAEPPKEVLYPQQRFCSECGSRLVHAYQFCPECGTRTNRHS